MDYTVRFNPTLAAGKIDFIVCSVVVADNQHRASSAILFQSIKNGASGTWGIIPMPAQTNLADDEIERLVTWILDQK